MPPFGSMYASTLPALISCLSSSKVDTRMAVASISVITERSILLRAFSTSARMPSRWVMRSSMKSSRSMRKNGAFVGRRASSSLAARLFTPRAPML
jgi:hypothetical protein